jgi:hypothetical protein
MTGSGFKSRTKYVVCLRHVMRLNLLIIGSHGNWTDFQVSVNRGKSSAKLNVTWPGIFLGLSVSWVGVPSQTKVNTVFLFRLLLWQRIGSVYAHKQNWILFCFPGRFLWQNITSMGIFPGDTDHLQLPFCFPSINFHEANGINVDRYLW